jgi:hypothetical protein
MLPIETPAILGNECCCSSTTLRWKANYNTEETEPGYSEVGIPVRVATIFESTSRLLYASTT